MGVVLQTMHLLVQLHLINDDWNIINPIYNLSKLWKKAWWSNDITLALVDEHLVMGMGCYVRLVQRFLYGRRRPAASISKSCRSTLWWNFRDASIITTCGASFGGII